jgi:hypothetical protein
MALKLRLYRGAGERGEDGLRERCWFSVAEAHRNGIELHILPVNTALENTIAQAGSKARKAGESLKTV